MSAKKPIPAVDKQLLLEAEAMLSLPHVGSDDRMRVLQMVYQLGRNQGELDGSIAMGDAMMASFDKATAK